jgi:hypothetical protein
LAGNPRKILPLSQSHFVPPTSLILNSRRQREEIPLQKAEGRII